MSDFIDFQTHENEHLHRIGGALLIPDAVTTSSIGDVADNGILEIGARDDHRHGRELDGAPVGTIMLWPSVVAPTDWLAADGGAPLRSDFPVLFDLIGTDYGIGDGSTTFNLPNCGAGPGGTFYIIKVQISYGS